MFVRRKKNKSGSISVQIISKSRGHYKVVKSIGSSKEPQEVEKLYQQAKQEINRLSGQNSFLVDKQEATIHGFLQSLSNSQVRVVGPELVFGHIFNKIGFSAIDDDLFRHLVIARLVYPGSKLKTIDYLYRYQGGLFNKDRIYRFLDALNNKYKDQVQEIAFRHTRQVLKGHISVVFYDITTLYFEASPEDDLRRLGFSKDGKAQNPQILLGLLVGLNGYPIEYEIFEGNKFEGHTFIPVLEMYSKKFNLSKPIVVADAGLLSKANIKKLESMNYQYILGARLKSEPREIQEKIFASKLCDVQNVQIKKNGDKRLVINYSDKRAQKDAFNRHRGLKRLERDLKSGKLTKHHINNRGYNKYLKMSGEIQIEIDYEKYDEDGKWDGLKGYITNSTLPEKQIISNYRKLWHIERAFRISKTDLRIRPIHHRLRHRIEAHVCIAFAAYAIYKELDRILKESAAPFSVSQAAELTKTMYEIEVRLPGTGREERILLKMDDQQKLLMNIIEKY